VIKIVYILMFLCVAASFAKDISQAAEYSKEGRYKEAVEILTDLPESAKVLNELGKIKYFMGDFVLSKNCYIRALETANDSLEKIIKLNLATCYFMEGNLNAARNQYNDALRLAKLHGDTKTYSKCLIGLGNFHYAKHEDSIAINYYKEALSTANNDFLRQQICNNLALIYEESNENELSMELFKKALSLIRNSDNKEEISIAYSNIGMNYLKQGDLENARFYLDSANSNILGSYQYEFLQKFLNQLKIREYENRIRTYYLIFAVIGLLVIILLSTIILFILYKKK
jgi:tetratricopeptide (TPR) repeat protein